MHALGTFGIEGEGITVRLPKEGSEAFILVVNRYYIEEVGGSNPPSPYL